MEYRVPAGYVQIGQAIGPSAEFLDIIQDRYHVLQRHLRESGMAAEGVDVAMLATLIAGLGDMQLECEIIHNIRKWPPGTRGPFDSLLVTRAACAAAGRGSLLVTRAAGTSARRGSLLVP